MLTRCTLWRVSERPGNSGRPVRVALVDLPEVVASFVRATLREAGMEIVAESHGFGDGTRFGSRGVDADVVIVRTTSTGLADVYADTLRSNANLKILTLSASSHEANVFQLRLLGADVGTTGLVEAIRRLMQDTPPSADHGARPGPSWSRI
jgi:hypothetical protein